MKNLSNYSDAFDFKSTKNSWISHLLSFSIHILHAHSNNAIKYAIKKLDLKKRIEIILMNFYVSFMEILMDRKCAKPSKNEYWKY